jgi:HK97 family phage prohead protease
MEKVFKTYRAEVKGVSEVDGTVDLFIPVSTNSVDRDGEIVDPKAFRKTLPKFMKRPVLIASHDYKDLTNQIGEWSKLRISDEGMDGVPKYYINEGNPQADWAFKLASKGVAAFSIGFMPKTWIEADEKSPRTFTEVELLEISQVIIPSNRDAQQTMRSKSVGDPVITQLLDDIATAEIVDLTEEPKPEVKHATQGEVKDELDYLTVMIAEAGINEDNKAAALKLAEDIIRRFTGADIPVEIRTSILTVLGPSVEEQLTALKFVVERRLADEAKKAEDEEHKLIAVRAIVTQMFAETTKQAERAQTDAIKRIVNNNLEAN